MKFYTVQKLKAWNEAKEKDYLTGNEEYIDTDWFMNSYQWMMEQMKKRLKNYNNEYPIWLWLDICNISFSQLLDDDYVLLEVELPQEEVLISNFDAWHTVLNNGYFHIGNIGITKEESWEYIFDKDKLEKFDYTFDNDDLQGVIGNINIRNIRVVKYITSVIKEG